MNSHVPITPAGEQCFHCGEAVPPQENYAVEIAGQLQPMCCPGCRAVAMMIAGSGLAHFYDQRTAFNVRPDKETPGSSKEWEVYDDDKLLHQFAVESSEHIVDARLLLGGISCAACTWLIETTLGSIPGVLSATVNLAQSRLDVQFDRTRLPMSEVFARISALGYGARPWQSSAGQEQARAEYRTDLRRLAVAGIGMMQVGMFSIALHAGDMQGISADYQQLLRSVSLLVTTFVVYFSARGFFSSAWRHLRHGALVMDLPVALAIGLAFAASCLATLKGNGAVYFDSVVMFTFLLLLARFIEKRLRFSDALAWQDAEQTLPDAAMKRFGSTWQSVSRRDLGSGDEVRILSGATIPIDGRVLRGRSAVREDSFNGEVLPRAVDVGDWVYAGTINLEGSLEIEATGSYAESRLAALQKSVERARHGKPALAHLADRIASVFIAAVLGATVVTGLVWWQLDASRAFWIALSVLVVSCPCALSLATPATLANAATFLRRRGVIVNGENALESLAHATHAIFDKTGTLTTGEFRLAVVHELDRTAPSTLLTTARALQRHSNHPIAAAFLSDSAAHIVGSNSEALQKAEPALSAATYIVGAGVEARSAGKRTRLGSAAFCREIAPSLPEAPDDALYWIALCADDQPLAWFGLRDALRPEAPDLIATLQKNGLCCGLLTGDASDRARDLGESLGFTSIETGQSPSAKLASVAALQRKGGKVLMVGDGLNDAPVLKQANASIAVSGATDLAQAQADFVVVDGDLAQVALLYRVAKRTRRVITQNFVWAAGYNLIGIPLAAMGLVPPWMAAVGMSLSSLVVVANATRLRRSKL